MANTYYRSTYYLFFNEDAKALSTALQKCMTIAYGYKIYPAREKIIYFDGAENKQADHNGVAICVSYKGGTVVIADSLESGKHDNGKELLKCLAEVYGYKGRAISYKEIQADIEKPTAEAFGGK